MRGGAQNAAHHSCTCGRRHLVSQRAPRRLTRWHRKCQRGQRSNQNRRVHAPGSRQFMGFTNDLSVRLRCCSKASGIIEVQASRRVGGPLRKIQNDIKTYWVIIMPFLLQPRAQHILRRLTVIFFLQQCSTSCFFGTTVTVSHFFAFVRRLPPTASQPEEGCGAPRRRCTAAKHATDHATVPRQLTTVLSRDCTWAAECRRRAS
jgi:hypothetical protein